MQAKFSLGLKSLLMWLTDIATPARNTRPDMGSEDSKMKIKGDNAVDNAKDDSENNLSIQPVSGGHRYIAVISADTHFRYLKVFVYGPSYTTWPSLGEGFSFCRVCMEFCHRGEVCNVARTIRVTFVVGTVCRRERRPSEGRRHDERSIVGMILGL